jgi:hypothetical protein
MDLAQIWIDCYLSNEVQTSLVQKIGYSPVNLEAIRAASADPNTAALTVTEEDVSKVFIPDWERVSPVYPEWIEAWNRTIRR